MNLEAVIGLSDTCPARYKDEDIRFLNGGVR
jgi:hypothetical protein